MILFREMVDTHCGTQKEINFSKEEGGSDARFFAQKKIPTIICGIKKGNAHANGEWVDMREAELFYEALQNFIIGL